MAIDLVYERGQMIIVNYKSKRELKKAIGEMLKCSVEDLIKYNSGSAFFVTNWDKTFRATITLTDGKIESVR